MEVGTVKFFDGRIGKSFGFLVDEKRRELFFHYGDGRDFHVVGNEVRLSSRPALLTYPKQGDELMFERGRNAKGEKASPWGFKVAYDRLAKELASQASTKKYVPSRHIAHIFDIRVPGPAESSGWYPNRESIGGYDGVAWWEYYKDHATGEVYRVQCTDGVNGGRGPYSRKDDDYQLKCFYALQARFAAAVQGGDGAILISRNERALMSNVSTATLLESAQGRHDGKHSDDGLEGGLVGHYHGIPVICDLTLTDDLPSREEKEKEKYPQ